MTVCCRLIYHLAQRHTHLFLFLKMHTSLESPLSLCGNDFFLFYFSLIKSRLPFDHQFYLHIKFHVAYKTSIFISKDSLAVQLIILDDIISKTATVLIEVLMTLNSKHKIEKQIGKWAKHTMTGLTICERCCTTWTFAHMHMSQMQDRSMDYLLIHFTEFFEINKIINY